MNHFKMNKFTLLIVGILLHWNLDSKSQNVKLEWLVKPSLKYFTVYGFSEGMAKVQRNIDYEEKFGFVNSQGEEIIPTKYDFASNFNNGVAIIGKGKKFGLVNKKGKIILPLEYDQIHKPSNGLIRVKKNTRYGFVDAKGKFIIPMDYSINYELKS